jgi:hypothetical protein
MKMLTLMKEGLALKDYMSKVVLEHYDRKVFHTALSFPTAASTQCVSVQIRQALAPGGYTAVSRGRGSPVNPHL